MRKNRGEHRLACPIERERQKDSEENREEEIRCRRHQVVVRVPGKKKPAKCHRLHRIAMTQAAVILPNRFPRRGSRKPRQPSSSPTAPVTSCNTTIIGIVADGINGAASPAARALNTAIPVA